MLGGVFRGTSFPHRATDQPKLDVVAHRSLAQVCEGTELVEGKRLTRRVAGSRRGRFDSVHVFILTL